MRRPRQLVTAGAVLGYLLLSACRSAPSAPPPADIIAQAISAKYPGPAHDWPVWDMRSRGTRQGPNGPYELVIHAVETIGGKQRVEILAPAPMRSVYADDGTAAWVSDERGVRTDDPDEQANSRLLLHVDWVEVLWPLRRPGYRFTSLGTADVRGTKAHGVRVSHDGDLDVDLYVDPATWLVIKVALRHDDVQHRVVYDETFFSSWKTANGVRYASHMEKLRDGKPKAVSDVEVTFSDTVDDAIFRRPSP